MDTRHSILEDLTSLQCRVKSQFLSEISEVGGNDVDFKTNTQAHILIQEVRSHGKEILFFLIYFPSQSVVVVVICCLDLFYNCLLTLSCA